MTPLCKSEAMAVVHATALGVTAAGATAKWTMKVFHDKCFTPVEGKTPEEIRKLRLREHASQAVFTRFLNMTICLVSQRGAWREATAGPIVEAADPCCEDRLGRSRVPSISTMRCIGWSRHDGRADEPRSHGRTVCACLPRMHPHREPGRMPRDVAVASHQSPSSSGSMFADCKLCEVVETVSLRLRKAMS